MLSGYLESLGSDTGGLWASERASSGGFVGYLPLVVGLTGALKRPKRGRGPNSTRMAVSGNWASLSWLSS